MQKKRRKPIEEKPSRPRVLQESPSVSSPQQLWVRPESNLRQGRRRTDGETNISPATGERLLALADIALGVKKSAVKSKAKVLSVEAHHKKMGQQKKKTPLQAN
jgi:hypothetical protein